MTEKSERLDLIERMAEFSNQEIYQALSLGMESLSFAELAFRQFIYPTEGLQSTRIAEVQEARRVLRRLREPYRFNR